MVSLPPSDKQNQIQVIQLCWVNGKIMYWNWGVWLATIAQGGWKCYQQWDTYNALFSLCLWERSLSPTYSNILHTAAVTSIKSYKTYTKDPGMLLWPPNAHHSDSEEKARSAPWKDLFLLHPGQQAPLGLKAPQGPVFWFLWAHITSFEVLQTLESILGHFWAVQTNKCCSLH